MSATFTNQYSTEGLSEKQIQNLIVSYLGWRNVFCWTNNSGSFALSNKDGSKRYFKAGLKGSADIIGIAADGRMIALEVKTAKGKTTPAQDDFLAQIKLRGGIAGIVRTIEDVDKLLYI